MNLKPLPAHTSRPGGCTLTGALSITTQIEDATTIVHGPRGCAHHNFSLLHATSLDNDRAAVPDLLCSGLSESDIVFGGGDALSRTISAACERDVSAVCVLSTCIAGTIGDDVDEICGRGWPVPVIPIPTAGFLGGTFQDGVNNALIALADRAGTAPPGPCVNIIGEKNLEYEVEENCGEVLRLLSLLGLPAGIRFVHGLGFGAIAELGAARLNILRDPSLIPVGERLRQKFGTPYIPSFPGGLSDTLSFIGAVAEACKIDGRIAMRTEQELQAETLADFADLAGSPDRFSWTVMDPDGTRAAEEAAGALHLRIGRASPSRPLPVHSVVGTRGVKRMLHRWRRVIHA